MGFYSVIILETNNDGDDVNNDDDNRDDDDDEGDDVNDDNDGEDDDEWEGLGAVKRASCLFPHCLRFYPQRTPTQRLSVVAFVWKILVFFSFAMQKNPIFQLHFQCFPWY